MNTTTSYHYVYRITNTVLQKHYYGKRSSKIDPKLDLGIKYFSSSKDKEFIQDQKANPQNYKYKIISRHINSKEAILKEIKLHDKFNVGINSMFYNKTKQTSTKFNTEGQSSWNLGKPFSKEVRDKMSKSRLGKKPVNKGIPRSEATKEKLRIANLGKKQTDETKKKRTDSYYLNSRNNKQIKFANIYNYATNKLIAENVIIRSWAKEHKYSQSHLAATARADRNIPSSRINRCHTKGIYAVYCI